MPVRICVSLSGGRDGAIARRRAAHWCAVRGELVASIAWRALSCAAAIGTLRQRGSRAAITPPGARGAAH